MDKTLDGEKFYKKAKVGGSWVVAGWQWSLPVGPMLASWVHAASGCRCCYSGNVAPRCTQVEPWPRCFWVQVGDVEFSLGSVVLLQFEDDEDEEEGEEAAEAPLGLVQAMWQTSDGEGLGPWASNRTQRLQLQLAVLQLGAK